MQKFFTFTAILLALSSNIKGQTGSALNFDGTNDFVNVGNVLGTSYTKEAWVMITNASLLNNIISGGSNGQHTLWAPAMYNNRLSAGHNGTFNAVQDPTPLSVGVWYHVAVTYDAATTTMRLYKNGVQVSSNTAVPAYTGGNGVRLGSYNGNNSLGGSLDEVRVWNIVRTQAQISSNMSCQLTSIPAGLQQYYRFNQGIAGGNNVGLTTLTDVAGTAQNGTLTNFTLTGSTSNWIAPGGVPNPASASITAQSNVSCHGGNNGSATVTAGGGGSFTYSWAPSGGTGATASGLTAGTYTVTATNQCGSSATATVQITEPSTPVSVNPIGSSPICTGESTTINANASGGSPQYTYSWSPGGMTNASEVVAPGSTTTYTVLVTDFTGCTASNTVLITVNTTPTVNVVSNPANGIVCSGSQATLTANGASSYSWTGGITNGVAFTPTATATYTVTGTTAEGCSATATATVTVTNCNNISQLHPAYCNMTNATLSTWLYNTPVSGATNYEYRFTNTVTSQVLTRVKGNSQPNMPLSYVAGLQYGESYYVQVRSFVNNQWTQYGNLTTCMITMAPAPPPTQLLPASCGATGLTNLSYIKAQGVAGSTQYWWVLQNGPSYYQGRGTTVPQIRMNQFTGITTNTTYTVTVYHYSAGTWSASSNPCTVTTGGALRLAGEEMEEETEEIPAEFSFGVSMYPNPIGAGQNPTVVITGADQKDALVTVLDLTGRVVASYQVYPEGPEYSTQLMDFPALSPGMYIMQVQIGDKVESEKFIAE
jgi:hypothetical protein